MILVWYRFRDSSVMEDFRVKSKIGPVVGSCKQRPCRQNGWRKQWQQRQGRIAQRLDKHHREPDDGLSGEQPVLQGANVQCVMGERQCGTAYGGVAVMHQLVRELQLAEAIDQQLHLLKLHKPYHESDHVLNFAYNALCDGTCLEDMELRRADEAYLDGLGARRRPPFGRCPPIQPLPVTSADGLKSAMFAS